MKRHENKHNFWVAAVAASLLYMPAVPYAETTPEFTAQQKQQIRSRFKEDAASILKVVDRWAKSWTDLDSDKYIACYSASYTPSKNTSNKSWQQSRRNRFKNQKWVKLALTGMVISVRANATYAVEFNQGYESDSFSDTTRKELQFRKEDGEWRIIAEQTLKK